MKASVVARRAFLCDVEKGDVVRSKRNQAYLVSKVKAGRYVTLLSEGFEVLIGSPHMVVTVYERKQA